MVISSNIITKLQSRLGVSCQPHLITPIEDYRKKVDKGCIEFDLPEETETINIVWQKYNEIVTAAKEVPAAELRAQVMQAFPLIGKRLLDAEAFIDTADLYDPSLGVNTLLSQTRTLLANDPVFAYRGLMGVMNPIVAQAATIVVAPTRDQFESIRLEETNGSNYGFGPDSVIQKMKELDAQYGLDIVGLGFASIEFLLKRLPADSEVNDLGQWLTEFCPEFDSAYPAWHTKGRIALEWN
jgi:hypothetical protein